MNRQNDQPNWSLAECAKAVEASEADPDWWVPATDAEKKKAQAVCKRCPIKRQCWRYAYENGYWGVWGGRLRGYNVEKAPPTQPARELGDYSNPPPAPRAPRGEYSDYNNWVRELYYSVMFMTQAGQSVAQIADALGVTPKTVSRHRAKMRGEAAA
jgi:hypothetical protein